jgi:hypothetical protein
MDWPGSNTHITQALFEVTGMRPYLIDITEFNVPRLDQLPPSGLTPANDKCSSRAGRVEQRREARSEHLHIRHRIREY